MENDLLLGIVLGFTACFLLCVFVLVVELYRIRRGFWASNSFKHLLKIALMVNECQTSNFKEGSSVISVLHGSGHVIITDGEKVWCRFGRNDTVLFYQDGSMPGDPAKVLHHE